VRGRAGFSGVRRVAGFGLVAIVVTALTSAVPIGAKELYRKGDFDVHLDTTLSVGGAVRVAERDSDKVYIGNGGTATNPEYLNRDDGDLNYDEWDVYSANAKALLELDMRWKNYGAFMRANMFYDVIQNCAHCTQRTDLSADARHRPENLKVMDAAAIALARDNNIPVIVFSIRTEEGLKAVLTGGGRYTVMSAD